MNKNSVVYVAGSGTALGSALTAHLRKQGFAKVIDPGPKENNWLGKHHEVDSFFRTHKPEYVFLVAGKSGGIGANRKYPAGLMVDNLLIQNSVIRNAHDHKVAKLLYVASACCYPRECPQPIREDYLLTGPLEPTNESYAVAKIAGIKLCQAYRQQHGANFIVGIPANPYGPGCSFNPDDSHVIEALILRMHEAKVRGDSEVKIWGSGKPRRDFIYIDDLASACVFLMTGYAGLGPVNLGMNSSISIAELAEIVKRAVGYQGKLAFDAEKPDGMPLKCLDSSLLRSMGWHAGVTMQDGVAKTYEWFLKNEAAALEGQKKGL